MKRTTKERYFFFRRLQNSFGKYLPNFPLRLKQTNLNSNEIKEVKLTFLY